MEGTREGRWRDGIAVKGEEGGDGKGGGGEGTYISGVFFEQRRYTIHLPRHSLGVPVQIV